MRNWPDSCVITGPLPIVYEDVPCHFIMMDAAKSEMLFGGQESKGTVYIPLYIDIPRNNTTIDQYRLTLLAPIHPRINQPMLIDTIRWSRIHQTLTVSIPNVA